MKKIIFGLIFALIVCTSVSCVCAADEIPQFDDNPTVDFNDDAYVGNITPDHITFDIPVTEFDDGNISISDLGLNC